MIMAPLPPIPPSPLVRAVPATANTVFAMDINSAATPSEPLVPLLPIVAHAPQTPTQSQPFHAATTQYRLSNANKGTGPLIFSGSSGSWENSSTCLPFPMPPAAYGMPDVFKLPASHLSDCIGQRQQQQPPPPPQQQHIQHPIFAAAHVDGDNQEDAVSISMDSGEDASPTWRRMIDLAIPTSVDAKEPLLQPSTREHAPSPSSPRRSKHVSGTIELVVLEEQVMHLDEEHLNQHPHSPMGISSEGMEMPTSMMMCELGALRSPNGSILVAGRSLPTSARRPTKARWGPNSSLLSPMEASLRSPTRMAQSAVTWAGDVDWTLDCCPAKRRATAIGEAEMRQECLERVQREEEQQQQDGFVRGTSLSGQPEFLPANCHDWGLACFGGPPPE